MSSTQPPMACAPFDKAAFVNILLNTYKHPDFGPQYMNDNIQQVACKIQNLDNKYMVNFVCGVLGIIQRDIHAVRELIKNDEGEDPVYASYSTFFGLGTETTNPGIRVQINRAIDTAKVKNYVVTRPTTTSGFDAAAAADGVDSKNAEKVSTPAPKKKPSSILASSAVSSVKRSNMKDAVHSAIHSTGPTPMKTSGVDEVAKTLNYDDDGVPIEIGGNGVGGMMDRVMDELSQVSLSVGTAGEDVVELDSARIEKEVKGLQTRFMRKLFNHRETEQLVSMATNCSSFCLDTIADEKRSDNFKSMLSILSDQESLRTSTAQRAESARGILQTASSYVSSNAALDIENAQNLRDEELNAAQQTHDDTVGKARLAFEEIVAKAALDLKNEQFEINEKYNKSKANAEMVAKVSKQELEESHAKSISVIDRSQKSHADLIKPKAIVKVIEFGFDMLSYYCEGDVDAAAVIKDQLTDHMLPALEGNNQDDMLKEIINWKAKDVMDL